MAGQARRLTSNPPIVQYPKLTKSLTAAEAQPLLAEFLEKSRKAPHLHPDAWLYSDGVKFGPKAGSSGGWVMHHLRRIEAGLRGEHLEAESKEALVAKFGEDAVGDVAAAEASVAVEGDDTRVDKVIEENQETNEKKRRKQEKKERIEREKASKKRKVEDVDELGSNEAEDAEQSIPAPEDPTTNEGDDSRLDKAIEENHPSHDKKRRKQEKKERRERERSLKKSRVESASKTTVHNAESPPENSLANKINEWQTKEDYQGEQTVLEGDVADNDPTDGHQVTAPPAIVSHDAGGEIVVPKAKETAEEKAARRAAKKARKEKRKGQEAG